MRIARVLATGAVALTSCSQKVAPIELSKDFRIYVDAKDISLVGTSVVVGDRSAIFREETSLKMHQPFARAVLEVARSGPNITGQLQLEYITPCGLQRAPLPVSLPVEKEQAARAADPDVSIDLESVPKVPGFQFVWVDSDDDKLSVTVGKAALHHGKNRLFDPGCAPSNPVRSNGAVIGTFNAPAADSGAVFITAKDHVCYTAGERRYAKNADKYLPPAPPALLRDAHVYSISDYGLKASHEYFLKPAPSSEQGADYSLISNFELISVPCD